MTVKSHNFRWHDISWCQNIIIMFQDKNEFYTTILFLFQVLSP